MRTFVAGRRVLGQSGGEVVMRQSFEVTLYSVRTSRQWVDDFVRMINPELGRPARAILSLLDSQREAFGDDNLQKLLGE